MWSAIQRSPTLEIPSLLAFMERIAPNSTREVSGASAEQIEALAAPHGGRAKLPPVYLDFLERMGASVGQLRFARGSTCIEELLDLREDSAPLPNPKRFLRYSTGEENHGGLLVADFFDLSNRSADGRDAAILRIDPRLLEASDEKASRPFASFSDLLRSVIVSRLCFETDERPVLNFDLDEDEEDRIRCVEFLEKLGFGLTEMGASTEAIPLEHRQRGVFGMLQRMVGSKMTLLLLKARDKMEESRLREVLLDNLPNLRGD